MLIIGFYHNYNYVKQQQSAYTIYWDCPKGSLGDSYWINAVKAFLFELGMKPHMHLVKISIFSLNNVTVRLTKIMNNLFEHLKILIFKVIFQCWKLVEFFWKEFSLKNIGLGDQLLLKIFFKHFDFWGTLFSKNVPNFCRLCS